MRGRERHGREDVAEVTRHFEAAREKHDNRSARAELSVDRRTDAQRRRERRATAGQDGLSQKKVPVAEGGGAGDRRVGDRLFSAVHGGSGCCGRRSGSGAVGRRGAAASGERLCAARGAA